MIRLLAPFLLAAAVVVAADESKPQLLSTTGAAGTWSDVASLQKDAEAKNPLALATLGEMLLTGDQVAKDVPRGLALLEEAAKAGQTSAAFRLGKVYDDGQLAPRDIAKSLEYYRLAAMAGSPEAQYNLGVLHVGGKGVKRDLQEGLAWLILAGRNGADGGGAQQVRDRLTSTNRAHIVAKAEERANELQTQVKKKPAATAASPEREAGTAATP